MPRPPYIGKACTRPNSEDNTPKVHFYSSTPNLVKPPYFFFSSYQQISLILDHSLHNTIAVVGSFDTRHNCRMAQLAFPVCVCLCMHLYLCMHSRTF